MFTTMIIAAICAVGGAAVRHLWPARAATVDAVLRDIGADAMRAALKRYPDQVPDAYAAAVAGAERALSRSTPTTAVTSAEKKALERVFLQLPVFTQAREIPASQHLPRGLPELCAAYREGVVG